MDSRRDGISRARAVLLALLGPLLVALALTPLRERLASATLVLVLVLVVVAVGAVGDRVAGALAAMSSGIWFDFFLAPPYNTLRIDASEDIEAAVLLTVVGLAVTEIALWGRRQQAAASRRGGYLDGVLRVADVLSEGTGAERSVADQVAAQIRTVLRIDRCRYTDIGTPDPRMAEVHHNGEVWRGDQQLDVTRDGLPTTEEICLPVRRGSRVQGCFVLTASTRVVRPSTEQLRIAVLLADQIARTDPSANAVDKHLAVRTADGLLSSSRAGR